MKSNILHTVKWMLNELTQISKRLDHIQPQQSVISPNWIKWKDAMEFFDYGDTQMAEMVAEKNLVVTKIGRRKFIHRDSIVKLMDDHIIQSDSNRVDLKEPGNTRN